MNPIPLTSPAGVLYAYACGVCHHVSAGASVLYVPDAPVPGLVRMSHEGAERCCRCLQCNRPHTRRDHGIWCLECSWWTAFLQIWGLFARGIIPNKEGTGPTICSICGSATTDYCRTTPRCIDCGDEHGSYSDGRCRDCHLDALFQED